MQQEAIKWYSHARASLLDVVNQHQVLLYCMWLSTSKYCASAHTGASANQCSASGLDQVFPYTMLAMNGREEVLPYTMAQLLY